MACPPIAAPWFGVPDFIPVLGYLDDLITVRLGILAVVKLIPPEIMAEHRAAAAVASERPTSRAGCRHDCSHLDSINGNGPVARLSLLGRQKFKLRSAPGKLSAKSR